MTRQQNRSEIRSYYYKFFDKKIGSQWDTCTYMCFKKWEKSDAEPHIVHWGMKIDFLLSVYVSFLSFSFFFLLHGTRNDVLLLLFLFFLLLFCWMRVCRTDTSPTHRKRNSFIIKFFLRSLLSSFWPLDEEKKMKENNKLSSFFFFFYICVCFSHHRWFYSCCCCYVSLNACVCQATNIFLLSFHIINEGSNECELSLFSSLSLSRIFSY